MAVRRVLVCVVIASLSLVPVEAFAAAGAPAMHAVSMPSFTFSPASLTVQVGDTVVWTDTDAHEIHTVTAVDGTFDSGAIQPGHAYSHTFTSAGTVPYYCVLHGSPTGDGMAGEITVEAVVATTGTTGTTVTGPAAPAAQISSVPSPAVSPSSMSTKTPLRLARTGSRAANELELAGLLSAIGALATVGARRARRRRKVPARGGATEHGYDGQR